MPFTEMPPFGMSSDSGLVKYFSKIVYLCPLRQPKSFEIKCFLHCVRNKSKQCVRKRRQKMILKKKTWNKT